MKNPRERDVEGYFCQRVKELGGITRKLKWIGRNAAPDRFVTFPAVGAYLVELKKPGKTPRADQLIEHTELWKHGSRVYVLSTCAEVDHFLAGVM